MGNRELIVIIRQKDRETWTDRDEAIEHYSLEVVKAPAGTIQRKDCETILARLKAGEQMIEV